jgi:hypothetical protein
VTFKSNKEPLSLSHSENYFPSLQSENENEKKKKTGTEKRTLQIYFLAVIKTLILHYILKRERERDR